MSDHLARIVADAVDTSVVECRDPETGALLVGIPSGSQGRAASARALLCPRPIRPGAGVRLRRCVDARPGEGGRVVARRPAEAVDE